MIKRMTMALVLIFSLSVAAVAAEPDPVVLTVAGEITKFNRGPTDGFADAFFAYHDIVFPRAFAFTRRDLEALGSHKLVANYPGKDVTLTVEGPRLSDVLDAVGANGATASVMAFDGYAAEIPLAELRKYPILLALKRDGRYLDIGGRGPAWVVYPTNDHAELAAHDDAKWVWSAFFIRVE